jgi:hypothetical protein
MCRTISGERIFASAMFVSVSIVAAAKDLENGSVERPFPARQGPDQLICGRSSYNRRWDRLSGTGGFASITIICNLAKARVATKASKCATCRAGLSDTCENSTAPMLSGKVLYRGAAFLLALICCGSSLAQGPAASLPELSPVVAPPDTSLALPFATVAQQISIPVVPPKHKYAQIDVANQINFSGIGGRAAAAALTVSYYPQNSISATEAASTFLVSIATDAAGNVVLEFIPSVIRRFPIMQVLRIE